MEEQRGPGAEREVVAVALAGGRVVEARVQRHDHHGDGVVGEQPGGEGAEEGEGRVALLDEAMGDGAADAERCFVPVEKELHAMGEEFGGSLVLPTAFAEAVDELLWFGRRI